LTLAFTDALFIVVLGISLIIYWNLGEKPRAQNITLLIICYFVYGYIEYWFLFIIFFSTMVNYFLGNLLDRDYTKSLRKIILSISIIFNLGYLFIFKYFNFFTIEISRVLLIFGLNLDPFILDLFLPLGISFYTLQLIAYLVDIYRNEIPSCKNFVKFSIFVAFFPKLTSGPIEHPKNFIPQLDKSKQFKDHYYNGTFKGSFQLILLGYFKKIVIADVIANKIAAFYKDPSAYSNIDAKIIVFLFTIQIYADFSGYTDLARGISRLFGFELMINFNQPYLSTNIQQFWRRWHISLMDWFKEYVYKPLGGNRKGIVRLLLNILIIFVISGIWHGVGMTFILWGVFHGLYMLFYRLITFNRTKANIIKMGELLKKNKNSTNRNKFLTKSKGFLGWFLTFQIVNFLWIFFRSIDIKSVFTIIRMVYFIPFDLSIEIINNNFLHLLIFTSIVIFTIDIIQFKVQDHEFFQYIPWLIRGLIYGMMIIMILMFSNIFTSYTPFIYQGF